MEQYTQFLLGRHRLDHAWFVPSIDESAQMQPMRSIHTLGFHIQSALNRGMLQHGLEAGAHIGWNNSSYRIVFADERHSMLIRNSFRSGDFSLGLFASFKPVPNLRFYAGAGPTVYWGRLPRFHGDNNSYRYEEEYHSIGTDGLEIDNRSHRYDIGMGLYARAGAEVIFHNGTSIGLAVRKLDATLSFGEYGRMRLREPQYLLTVGYYYL